MVELEVNGKIIDLESKGNEIKYTKKIADILDIASVSSSYTNSFTAPKTPNNTSALEFLGISGDTSSVPYTKIPAKIKNNGFDIVTDGLLNVSETSDKYKISVIDGIIELFKSLDNKTIGVDLNLSNFNHEKNIQTVVESITNEFYKYIVADYGGLNIHDGGINIDYLSPSFSVKKLLELIFQTFGFTVDFAGINNFIDGLFITYPLGTALESSQTMQSALLKIGQIIVPYEQLGTIWRANRIATSWSQNSVIDEGTVNLYRYIIPQDSVYTFNIKIQGYALYKGQGFERYKPFRTRVFINGIAYTDFLTDPYEIVEDGFSVFCNAGDIVTVQYFVDIFWYFQGTFAQHSLKEFHFKSVNLDIKRTSQGNISLTNAMKSFKITDFLKEIIWRTAVTPYFDENKVVKFLSIEERLSASGSLKMPGKFIRRTSEKYIKSSYAQDNTFNMKYNNEGQDNYNGHIFVNNANIEASKVLATSQLYAPENYLANILDLQTAVVPMWSKTPKEESDGNVSIDYKPLDNRFYFLRFNTKQGTYKFTSQTVSGEQTVNAILYANTERTLFSQTVPSAYRQYQKIFENFRSHTFELALSLNDILTIDLKRIFYVEEESKYYLINKIDFQEGQTSTAECIACVPYVPQQITITSLQALFPAGRIGIAFNYSGFITNTIVLEYNRNNTFWTGANIPSASPQAFQLPVASGTYQIRLVYEDTVSNIATITF